MSVRTGRCLCGEVSYRIDAEPVVARVCWCRDCQRFASNGSVNAVFPRAALAIAGEPASYVSVADSGNRLTRYFCRNCGSHLFAESTGRPGFAVVRVGTLDEPSSIAPSANIWAASAPSWACLDDSLTRVERQPAAPSSPPATS